MTLLDVVELILALVQDEQIPLIVYHPLRFLAGDLLELPIDLMLSFEQIQIGLAHYERRFCFH